jgi:hypothetical protein
MSEPNQIRGIAIVLLVCLCASSSFAQTPAPLSNLATLDWSVKQAKILNAQSNDTVWKFMNGRWGNNDLSPGGGKLCEFHFVDLRHSGQLSLVVIYDGSGTADCNDLDVFDKTPSGFEDYDFDTTTDFSFDSIEDLNGDGHHELVVNAGLAAGGHGTGHCVASWPVIYAWNGNGYADVSSKYRKYYEQQLASLQKQIRGPKPQEDQTELRAAIQDNSPVGLGYADVRLSRSEKYGVSIATTSPSPVPLPNPEDYLPPSSEGLDCTEAEAAKIERFLGSRSAGLKDAIRWSHSDDPDTRYFAATILSEIGTPQAIKHLRSLSQDPDREVASSARDGLRFVTEGPDVNPTIHGELLTPDYASPLPSNQSPTPTSH